MPDAGFADPRLARLYHPLDPDRSDLDVYAAMAGEFGAATILDIGCGTGTLACLLAQSGLTVIGAHPAAASLDLARRKPGADRVRWLHAAAADLPELQVDLAVMTGNVAQVFVTDQEWAAALRAAAAALRPGGRLVFESRVPQRQQWLEWNRDQTYCRADLPGIGPVQAWIDLTEVAGSLVSFRGTYVFEADDLVLTSESTLRFRSRAELEESVTVAGLVLDEVRDAPDRPGREFVIIARRPAAYR